MGTKNKNPRILIGIPTMGTMSASLVAHLVAWCKSYPGSDIGCYFTYKVQPVDRARNEIVGYMFEPRTGEPFTHLFFVDSDTVPPRDALKRLLAADKDIVTGVTPMLYKERGKTHWGTLDNAIQTQTKDAEGKVLKTEPVKRNTGMQKILKCGGSCLLIRREVFEKLQKPYFKFLYNEDHTKHIQSEDFYFCEAATKAGYEIWCDTSIVCNHFKEIQL